MRLTHHTKIGKNLWQASFLLYLIVNIKSLVLMNTDWYNWSLETAFWNSGYCSPGSLESHGYQNHLVPGAFCTRIFFWFLWIISPCKETSSGDNSPPAYPIMQKTVSNLEGLLKEFLSWDFKFPICPRTESLQNLHRWNLSHSMSRELYYLEIWCQINPSWPGKEWPVLPCSALSKTALKILYNLKSTLQASTKPGSAPSCCEILN